MTNDSSNKLRFLPVGLDVRGKDCLVVGGGAVGTRKALTLSRAGASVVVVSPKVTQELAGQIEAGRVRWEEATFRNAHLEGVFLAIAASDDEAINAEVARLAAESGALVCDASSAERSDVVFAALLQHDGTTVAVFTDGHDPARAARTRDKIAEQLAAARRSGS